MEIKVGSKWVIKRQNYIVNVVFVNEKNVFYEYEDGLSASCSIKIFKELFKPNQETYKWVKVNLVDLGDGKRITHHQYWEDKDFELLHNYKRYHKQCDNVEFEDDDTVWHIDNETLIGDINLLELGILTPKFSTEEHAETFLKLAKENGCL